jgi:hypothetical protein
MPSNLSCFDRDQALEVLQAKPAAAGWEWVLDRLARCVRPVAGVTLTPEEAARALDWCRRSVPAWSPEDEALAARLEAWRG